MEQNKEDKPDWLIYRSETIVGKFSSYRFEIIDFGKLAKPNIKKKIKNKH